MPHLFPSDPLWPDDSGAERLVWEALREQLPDDAALFHGVRIQDDADEREIDLLVAWPGFGIAVIEVKGGLITRDGDGWWQADAQGRHRIDPVGQAQRARHALSTYLVGHGSAAGHAQFVHMVALPFVRVPRSWEAIDLPRAMVIDQTDLDSPGAVAAQVEAAIRRHGKGTLRLDVGSLLDLAERVAARLQPHSASIAAAEAHERIMDALTEDQAHYLDLLSRQQRMRVLGAAGSGKTVLALEQARRRAKAGERVALLCYSRGLGRHLQRVTGGWKPAERPAYVGLFHNLAIEWGAPPPPSDDAPLEVRAAYYETDLPEALGRIAADTPTAQRFDSIVVDEAQDFGEIWWPALVQSLRDREHGGLFVFGDDDQTVFARVGDAPITLEPFTLTENLRSTKQIAQTFGALSTWDVHARGRAGLPVRILDVPYDDAVDVADDMVDTLIDEGWDESKIALITTGRRHVEQRNTIDLVGYDEYWDDYFDGTGVFYGHVLNFKGLERSVVVLAINGFQETERARSMLYTGMSRARSLLVLVGPRDQIESIGGEAIKRRLAAAETWVTGGDG
ncbi:NERD nuclease [Xylanimonas allomyrinae]|uniref:NERD nuclease n=1 Tax=Xylanimonas allomyrinae TaxID=2509459 RepID=A0A4V0YE31_9MICO|nr:NERD domain-containing protein/DEAD/DEAH box helicase [Xylanimonas allomyrinae]QAY62791.1 NERD nuclease [Xylanimonas allomyrinae]